MKKILGCALLVSAIMALTSKQAVAIPILQLYAEGATYDAGTETWVISDWSVNSPIRIWTIGNVHAKGTISNVRLSVAYSSTYAPILELTASTTGGLGGFTDPSTPAKGAGITGAAAGDWLQTVTNGSVPKLSDGSDLPSHGVYGLGTYWQEFDLGNFTMMDSPIADFITSFPTTLYPNRGQINVYEVRVIGGAFDDDMDLHFDLYDSVQAGNKIRSKFAPFSHDAEANGGEDVPVPVPPTSLVFGLALAGLAIRKRFF